MLLLIQAIDFEFGPEQVELWKDDRTAQSSWREMLIFLSQHLNISQLYLTIDAGSAFDIYCGWTLGIERSRDISEFYRSLIEPLEEIAAFRGLRQFHVFLAVFWDYETCAEKAVKGPGYDSAKDGKIPLTRRNPFFPHGVPDQRGQREEGRMGVEARRRLAED